MIPLEEVHAEVTERLAKLGFGGSTEEACGPGRAGRTWKSGFARTASIPCCCARSAKRLDGLYVTT